MLLVFATGAQAQTSQHSDSIMAAIQLRSLQQQRQQLQAQIKTEDAKRNSRVDGVSAQAQEAINDRQDSICLNLRSQLVDVELRLQELQPAETATAATTSGATTTAATNWPQQASAIIQKQQ